ncbi:MAG: TolC family protein [Puniceicoccaceae bacterium]
MNKKIATVSSVMALSSGVILAETLTLSMEEAVAAALDRNYAIQIERIEPQIAEQEIRAATGAFDPVLQSELEYRNSELTGFTRNQESTSGSVSVGSTLPIGTQLQATVQVNERTTPFDPFTGEFSEIISTSETTFTGIVVTQPILRGFGKDGTYAGVRIARESSDISWQTFRAEVMDTVQSTVTAYENLYFAQENLRIAERNRDLALQLLKDNKKRVETGSMASLDIVQAESEAALREVSVISARAVLQQARNFLKSLIWDNPESVLDLDLNIIPPDEPDFFEPVISRDYQIALQNQPEYLSAVSGLNIREIQVRNTKRNALPQLDLVGSAGRTRLETGFGDSMDGEFSDSNMSYSMGLVLSVPFPNKTRSAEKAQAYLRRNQAQLGVKQLEQNIRLQLDNAATQLTADWERIQAARIARELAEKSLEAEEKKLQAGTSTTFVVLRLQGDLAIAEIREINALSDYIVSLANYNRARGKILDTFNIQLQ